MCIIIKNVLNLLVSIFLTIGCNCYSQNLETRESILDRRIHIEDSITYHIPDAPRLCESIDSKKDMVDVGNCKLYVEIEGNGIPLVIINGGPGGTHHGFHPWFSRAAEFCQVVYYDQRGCGLSDYKPGAGYSFLQAVNDLEWLREELKIDRWIVLGFSYGGGLAQYYAAKYPHRTLGLVLVGSTTLTHDEILNNDRERDFISEVELNKIREIYGLYRAEKLDLEQLLYNKEINGDWKRQSFHKPTKEMAARIAKYEWVNDDDFNYDMSTSYRKYDFTDLFLNCPIPTLICEGEWDLSWTKEKKELIRKYHPNAKMIIYKQSGHSIYDDEPEKFFSDLNNFIESIEEPDTDLSEWATSVGAVLASQEELIKSDEFFINLINQKGIEVALDFYKRFKIDNANSMLFFESSMNSLGYKKLADGDMKLALGIFRLNVDEYPDSWNAYDSLAEVYLKLGKKKEAIKYYKKSLELNPENENGKNVLLTL